MALVHTNWFCKCIEKEHYWMKWAFMSKGRSCIIKQQDKWAQLLVYPIHAGLHYWPAIVWIKKMFYLHIQQYRPTINWNVRLCNVCFLVSVTVETMTHCFTVDIYQFIVTIYDIYGFLYILDVRIYVIRWGCCNVIMEKTKFLYFIVYFQLLISTK